ncbi:unnamed protein product [Lymnaea stagnalis]|uniref:Galectin n=1 Tax=Lymnaea stagnalis TaxID=6523 RepID=A0AAV2H2Y8_LYMST
MAFSHFFEPSTAIVERFDCGLGPGKNFTLQAVPSGNFTVSLMAGDCPGSADIALLVSVKFKKPTTEMLFACRTDGQWSEPEYCCTCPCSSLEANAPFELGLSVSCQYFKISVNRKVVGKFDHRCDPNLVNHYSVAGAVSLRVVSIH